MLASLLSLLRIAFPVVTNILNQRRVIGLDAVHRLTRAAAELEHDPLLAEFERPPGRAVKLPILELG